MTMAVMLLSGGLDSTLAAKVLLDNGVKLEAINYLTVFCTCTPKKESCLASRKAVEQLGIELKVFNISEEYLEIIKNPAHGYGRNLNPCIDCRIFMFSKARDYMNQVGASFVVTGEVLGERPMSQKLAALKLIERESGLEGLILRPLSARLLEPTVPEKEGWINRDKLLAIRGRSRKPQISLARDYGIEDYPCPAGGCLLTDPGFANRMRDLMEHAPNFTLNDVTLLKAGRHFRLSSSTKLIIGRNEAENERLFGLAKPGDVMLDAQNLPGPLAVLRGQVDESHLAKSAAIVAAHSKKRNEKKVRLSITTKDRESRARSLETAPAAQETYEFMRI